MALTDTQKTNRITLTNSGFYRIKFRINPILKPFFNKSFITKSFKTRDYGLAVSKANYVYNHYEKILKRSTMLSSDTIQALVDRYTVEVLEQDDKLRANSNATVEGGDAQFQKDVLTDYLGAYRQDYAHSRTNSVVDDGIELLSKNNITYNEDDTSHKEFMFAFLTGKIELFTELIARCSGKPSIANKIAPALQTQGNSKTLITDAIDKYINYYNDKARDSSDKQKGNTLRIVHNTIVPYLQYLNRLYVDDVTVDDLLKMKDYLANYKPKGNSKFKNLSIDEVYRTEIPAEDKIKSKTVNDVIIVIKDIFSYCTDVNIISINPAVRLTKVSNSNSKTREAYTIEEIHKLFTWFDTLDTKLKLIYMTVAYSGMRLSEVWKIDIRNEDNIYYFYLDAKDSKTKSSRKIPIASKLLELDVINQLPKALVKYNDSNKVSRYFNAYVRSEIIPGTDKTLYNLRHSFITSLLNACVDKLIVSKLAGHSSNDNMTTTTYFKAGFQLPTLATAVETLVEVYK